MIKGTWLHQFIEVIRRLRTIRTKANIQKAKLHLAQKKKNELR